MPPPEPRPVRLSRRDRLEDWIRVIVGATIVAMVPMAQNWYSAERAEDERTRHLRGLNELKARADLAGPPVPVADAVIVRPSDLARLYRDDPRAADRAYQ